MQTQELPLVANDHVTQESDGFELFEELEDVPRERIECLLHDGGKMLLCGERYGHKSWLLEDLGLSAAKGRLWINLKTQKSNVLLIDTHNKRPFLQKRIRHIMKAKGISNSEIQDNLFIFPLASEEYREDLVSLTKRIRRLICMHQINLLLIDSIKLNTSRQECESLMRLLDNIIFDQNVALVLVTDGLLHHGNLEASIDEVHSSGILGQYPESTLRLKNVVLKNGVTPQYLVETNIMYQRPISDFTIEFEYPLFRSVKH